MSIRKSLILLFLATTLTGAAAAETPISLPDSSQSTTFAAEVSQRAEVAIPATVSFTVADVASVTNSAPQTISASQILLGDSKKLRISLQANAANFTPPTGGTTTWAAADLSWNNGSPWTGITGGAGSGGTLSSGSFTTVATSDSNVSTLSTSSLRFTLAAKSNITRAGAYTLAATWKFESI